MIINKILILASLTWLCLIRAGCHKEEAKGTLEVLYSTYRNAMIEECTHEGNTVYKCSMNAYDAGSAIYDEAGNLIADCNYAWGKPDAMCNQLSGCKVVYCVKDNIWGRPPVNVYGLKKH